LELTGLLVPVLDLVVVVEVLVLDLVVVVEVLVLD
jgi:hypothetical protein